MYKYRKFNKKKNPPQAKLENNTLYTRFFFLKKG